MGIFDSITDLVTNVAKVVVAPIEVIVDLADTAVKPAADAADQIVKSVKLLKEQNDG